MLIRPFALRPLAIIQSLLMRECECVCAPCSVLDAGRGSGRRRRRPPRQRPPPTAFLNRQQPTRNMQRNTHDHTRAHARYSEKDAGVTRDNKMPAIQMTLTHPVIAHFRCAGTDYGGPHSTLHFLPTYIPSHPATQPPNQST